MGRPAHKPDPVTRRQVEALAGYGVPEIDIAGVIGIDPKTLRKHYREELKYGHVKANAKVAENLFRKATGDGRESVIAAIFWMKTRAGWKETTVHETEVRHQVVVRMPPPVRDIDEWMRLHAPKQGAPAQANPHRPKLLTVAYRRD